MDKFSIKVSRVKYFQARQLYCCLYLFFSFVKRSIFALSNELEFSNEKRKENEVKNVELYIKNIKETQFFV